MVKDFVNVAGILNVSHMLMFTRTQVGPYLKVCRFPRGPTMTFKVDNYTLSRDVRSALKRQVTYEKQYLNHPLLILNGFSTSNEESGVPTKKAAVTFKIPDCDDRSGKGMGDIMAGKIITALNKCYPSTT